MTPRKKLLFVDDDEKILAGLKRSLHHMRNEWDTTFALSGETALALMSGQAFDAIVTDLRMPEMNGMDLLSAVEKRHPLTIRIILSGQAEAGHISQAVSTAHQYLTKPIDAGVLISNISKTFAILDRVITDGLRSLISQFGSLPSIPAAYHRLMTEIESPDASIQKIGQIISEDISMTAKILHLVNSAFFSLQREVSDPKLAVTLLGLETVAALILSLEIFSQFENSQIFKFSIDKIWQHSVRTGAIARNIAEMEGLDDDQAVNAYTAGLLHDIGTVMMVANIPMKYAEVLAKSASESISRYEIEKQVFDATHAQVGAYLLALWGLPEPVIGAVAYHHEPELGSPEENLNTTGIVHVANSLEYMTAINRIDENMAMLNTAYLTKQGINDRIPVWQKASIDINISSGEVL